MKLKKVICIFCIFLFFMMAGCESVKSNEELIQDKLEKFCVSYNAGDLEQVLTCFDSETRRLYEAAVKIGNGIASNEWGMELSDLFSLGSAMSEDATIENLNIALINIEKREAFVEGQMYLGDGVKCQVEITMIQENGDWFLQEVNDV